MRKLIIGALLLNARLLLAQDQEPDTTAGACTPSDTVMCLNSRRFAVSASWRKADGSSGQGHAVRLTDDTGYFWFFDASNIEVATKVLDACGVNNNFWVFGSGLTNVGVTMNVTDTATGQTKPYTNPVNTPFVAIQDTSAFSTCGTPTPQVSDVTGGWVAFLTVNGVGNAASLTMNQTGNSVTGAASVFDAGGGRLTGTINGNTLTFRVDEVNPCPGTFNGSGIVSGDGFSIHGSGTGSDCGGSYTRDLTAAKTFVAGNPAASSADMTGSWNATLSLGGNQYSAILTFVQNGNNLAGTAAITIFGNGSMSGSIVDQKLVVTINELSPCLGFFTAVANNATESSVSGNIAGSDCGGSYQGTFSANKR